MPAMVTLGNQPKSMQLLAYNITNKLQISSNKTVVNNCSIHAREGSQLGTYVLASPALAAA